jgi:hypothetical protein
MKIKRSILEEIVYILMCIGSFGVVAMFRVVITMAIRHAFEKEDQEE